MGRIPLFTRDQRSELFQLERTLGTRMEEIVSRAQVQQNARRLPARGESPPIALDVPLWFRVDARCSLGKRNCRADNGFNESRRGPRRPLVRASVALGGGPLRSHFKKQNSFCRETATKYVASGDQLVLNTERFRNQTSAAIRALRSQLQVVTHRPYKSYPRNAIRYSFCSVALGWPVDR